MKKFLVILMVVTFVLGMTGLALALDPSEDTPFTFTESAGQGTIPTRSVGPMNNIAAGVYGNSAWNYDDMYDTSYPFAGDSAKFEGSYKRFDAVTNAAAVTQPNGTIGGTAGTDANSALDANVGLYLGGPSGPHGNYDTTTNKCKVCHAVHRANGAFKLMRVDDAADACNYCHIGSHRHSLRGAYFRGEGTIHATNGHTIGAKKTIPDSSTWQWLEAKTLTGGNDEASDHWTINVRRYDSSRNKIFKWYNRHGWSRTGPSYLYCFSCHQPHNATDLIWKPDTVNGYKLLRNAPSGSTSSSGAMRAYRKYSAGQSDDRIKVVEFTLSSTTTGGATTGVADDPAQPKTIYTKWKGIDLTVNSAATGMTVWCADCHNLNIGYKETSTSPNWAPSYGQKSQSHSDRTHPVPMVAGYPPYAANQTGISGCQSCHPGDMRPPVVNNAAYPCGGTECHIGGASYNALAFYSDWPHSAATSSTKLLGDDYNASTEHIDMICLRCHDGVGTEM